MAHETADPRTPFIATVAFIAVASFIGIRAFLVSFFSMNEIEAEQTRAQHDPPAQLRGQRAHEDELLTRGTTPIDRAMATLIHGDRPAVLTPRHVTDNAGIQAETQVMEGWNQMPTHWTPPSLIAPPPSPPVNAPTMEGGPSTTDTTTAPTPAAPAPAVTVPAAGGPN